MVETDQAPLAEAPLRYTLTSTLINSSIQNPIQAYALSDDCQYLATLSSISPSTKGSVIRLFDLDTLALLRKATFTETTSLLAFSARNELITSAACQDGKMKCMLLDADTMDVK